jgi:CheY-like chemotaxis protein
MVERKPRIAVVDDDDEFVAMMEVLLTEEGFQFVRAPSDGDALESLGRDRPDLAIVDLRGVGDAGGLKLVRRMRDHAALADLPVLVCSADVQVMREHASELAVMPNVASLEKPFRIDTLLGTVGRLLSGSSSFPPAAGPLDPSAVVALEEQLGHIGRACVWSTTDAWVTDTRPGLLRCAATWTSRAELEPFAMVSRRIRLPLGGGLPGRVWASGRAVWAEDLGSGLNFPRLPTAHRVGLHSAAAVPVWVDESIVGVVAGYSTRRRAPDPVALERLSEAAEATGPILQAAGGTAD